MNISVKRKNYYRTDVSNGSRFIGFMISRPKGYWLLSTDPDLRWFKRRYFKTPADLLASIKRRRRT